MQASIGLFVEKELHRKVSLAVIALTFCTLALMFTTYAAIDVTTTLNSSGTIAVISQNLGLFYDSSCTIPLTNLDWGSPAPGTIVTRTFYVKNTLPSTSLSLSMTTTNWNPITANGPLAITWNRQGTILLPGQSTETTIALTVSPSTASITYFSVQILISGKA
jgi:hypothetical protein